jgi:hypothetical protein
MFVLCKYKFSVARQGALTAQREEPETICLYTAITIHCTEKSPGYVISLNYIWLHIVCHFLNDEPSPLFEEVGEI